MSQKLYQQKDNCKLVNWFNHTSGVTAVTPTDRPKSARNRCVIEVFGCIFYVVTLIFGFFCWYRGFGYMSESDLFLFFLLPGTGIQNLNILRFDEKMDHSYRQRLKRSWKRSQSMDRQNYHSRAKSSGNREPKATCFIYNECMLHLK